MKNVLAHLARIALLLACLAYVFWDLDLEGLRRAFSSFSPAAMAALLLYQFVGYVPPALRLRFLSRGRASLAHTYAAFALTLGVNNLLPAKLGELAKVLYLRLKAGIPGPQGLGMVFLERFADLNAALLMAFAGSFVLGGAAVATPLLAVVLGIWVLLAAHRFWPGLSRFLLRLVPIQSLRRLASETLDQVGGSLQPALLGKLSLLTVLVWTVHCSTLALLTNWVAGLGLGPGQILGVFALATLGMAVPATPGGLGVFEAAIMFGLGLAGVGRDQALAIGLAMRAVQYLPSTGLALVVLARSKISLRELREMSPSRETAAGSPERVPAPLD